MVEPGEGYRLMRPDEYPSYDHGDEFWCDQHKVWHRTAYSGRDPISIIGGIYRARLSTRTLAKPPVSLMKALKQSGVGNDKG